MSQKLLKFGSELWNGLEQLNPSPTLTVIVNGSGAIFGASIDVTYQNGQSVSKKTSANGAAYFGFLGVGSLQIRIIPPDLNTYEELDLSATVTGNATITAVLSKTPACALFAKTPSGESEAWTHT